MTLARRALGTLVSIAFWIGFSLFFGESVLDGVAKGVLFVVAMAALELFRGRRDR